MKIIICVILSGPNKWPELESTEFIIKIQLKKKKVGVPSIQKSLRNISSMLKINVCPNFNRGIKIGSTRWSLPYHQIHQ